MNRRTSTMCRTLLVAGFLLSAFSVAGCDDSGTSQNNPAPADAVDDAIDADDATTDASDVSDAVDTAGEDADAIDTIEDAHDASDTDADAIEDASDADDTADATDADAECTSCGAPRWSALFGTSGYDRIRDVAQDSNGNVYITGAVNDGDVDFGGGTLSPAGDSDIILAKFDRDGTHLWSRRYGNADYDEGSSIVATSTGEVYLGAFGNGGIDFGSGTAVGNAGANIYLVKFDDTGGHLWSKSFDVAHSATISDMDVGQNGDLTVVGSVRGDVDLGGGMLDGSNGTVGDFAMLLGRFDAAGNHQWSKTLDGGGSESLFGVATDANGHAWVAGYFDLNVDMGGGELTSDFGGTAIAEYDADGDHVWSKALTAVGGYAEGTSMDVDSGGNLYVGGNVDAVSDFDGTSVTPRDGVDGFIAKFDSQGSMAWVELLGQADTDTVFDVAVTSSGGVYVVGDFESTLLAGAVTLTSTGEDDVYVARLDGTGEVLWARSFGGTGDDTALSVAAYPGDHVFVAGATDDSVTIDGQQHQSAGSDDYLLFSLTP